MLIPFVIDKTSLDPEQGDDVLRVRIDHERLIDVWIEMGLLVVDAREDGEASLLDGIRRLPQKIRSDWLEVWGSCPRLVVEKWDGVVIKEKLAFLGREAGVRLAVVDNVRALVEFDLKHEELETVCKTEDMEITVSRFFASDRCKPVREARALATKHIEPEDSQEEIWVKRFEMLVKAPGLFYISVVDRYAGERWCLGDWSSPSGLQRFLMSVKKSAEEKRHLNVFTAVTKEMKGKRWPSEEDLRRLWQELKGGNLKTLKIWLLPDDDFGKIAHDRFVRFGGGSGGGYVWSLGCGLEIFERKSGRRMHDSRRTTASFVGGNNVGGYRKIEEEIKNSKGTIKHCFRG